MTSGRRRKTSRVGAVIMFMQLCSGQPVRLRVLRASLRMPRHATDKDAFPMPGWSRTARISSRRMCRCDAQEPSSRRGTGQGGRNCRNAAEGRTCRRSRYRHAAAAQSHRPLRCSSVHGRWRQPISPRTAHRGQGSRSTRTICARGPGLPTLPHRSVRPTWSLLRI